MVKNLGVVGSPIAHSLSPVIHQAAYDLLGLEWRYGRREVGSGQLHEMLHTLDESWRGLSVTMPLKVEAYDLASEHDADALTTRTANTLIRIATGWKALNTDIKGLERALLANVDETPDRLLILGSGATAKSALLSASRAFPGAQITLAARNSEATADLTTWVRSLASDFDAIALTDSCDVDFDLAISTLPAEAQRAAIDSPIFANFASSTLFDVAYNPWPSTLATSVTDLGGRAISGIEMLLQQGLLQIEAFIEAEGRKPLANRDEVLSVMRAAAARGSANS